VLDAGLQARSDQSGEEEKNDLPRPAGNTSFDAAQDTVVFLGCECTLPAQVQLFIDQYPQVLLGRAALNPFIPQPVLILQIYLMPVQDPPFGLVEPHKVHTGPLLEPVQVPLHVIPSLHHVNCTTYLGVISELAEDVLNPTVHDANKDLKQFLS